MLLHRLILPIEPAVLLPVLLSCALVPVDGLAQCLHSLTLVDLGTPPGDLNEDGAVTIADVQCSVLTSLWQIAGQTEPAPMCVAGPPALADVQCDGNVTVSDVVVIIGLALGLPINAQLDADADGCPDACTLPVIRHAFATHADGLATGGDYRLRPAPTTPALLGSSTGGGYLLRTRPFVRLHNQEEQK